MSDIADAKGKLPLPALMHRLGLGQHAKKSAHCPFHDDKHNSFSVWRNGAGLWFFKCHANCGEGDEITLLELHKRIPNSEATKLFLEMAGVNGSGPPTRKTASPAATLRPNERKAGNAFDWRACVQAFTDKHIEHVAKWRGFSLEFLRELRDAGLIGIFNGLVAFPVHDRVGDVVAAHYRLKDGSWRYYPQGAKVRPLIIGELQPDRNNAFESYWDGLDYMDKSGERDGVIITRGASNGALVAELIPESSTLCLWTQNDEAGEKWQCDICVYTKATVKRARIPARHKDLNDWMRAGATVDDLISAVANAEVLRETNSDKSESTEWPEIRQASPFPLHCLPPACEAMARSVCETLRVLESLPGCCTLGFSSGAIGSGLQVRSGPNRVTRGNLYILPSAESGSGKSETSRHLANPFLQFEAERLKAWKIETLPGLLAERDILESEVAKLKKLAGSADGAFERDEIRSQLQTKRAALEDIEIKLRAPVLSCEDITSQKLAELLAHNGEQLASVSADAGEIVNVLLGRYNKLDRTDESVYVKAFTGDCCKVDRKNSEPVLLQAPCLSALWLTQPDKLESLLAERSLSDGGLIPRILVCHTHCEAQEIIKDAPEISPAIKKAYADLIRDLIETYRLADEAFTIKPTPEALEAMNAHYNAIVKRRRVDLRDVTIYAARWNEQAWRIAVCLHAGLHGAHAHDHTLELDTAKSAIELADWFATQQLEILSASREKARREVWDKVLSLLANKPEGIRASDVYRARIVRNADEAHALLVAMEAGGELSGRDEQPETGGHVTRIFTRARK